MISTRYIKNKIAVNTVEESDTLDDILHYIKKHIDEWKHLHVLWNMSSFDFSSLDSNSIYSFIASSEISSKKRMGQKTAITTESDLGFGMMRMLEMLAVGTYKLELEVFRTETQGLTWLLK